MSGMLSSPKIATPAQPQAAPGITDPLVQQNAALTTKAAASAAGYGSTILTSGSGLQVPQQTAKKILLGG